VRVHGDGMTRALLLAALVLLAAVAAVPATAAPRGTVIAGGEGFAVRARADDRDARRACVSYTARGTTTAEPGRVRRFTTAFCARVPPPGRLRTAAALRLCTTAPGAVVALGAAQVARVNASQTNVVAPDRQERTVRRASRHPLPRALGPRGAVFLVPGTFEGRAVTLTSYAADGTRLGQQTLGPFPTPACAGPPASPSRR